MSAHSLAATRDGLITALTSARSASTCPPINPALGGTLYRAFGSDVVTECGTRIATAIDPEMAEIIARHMNHFVPARPVDDNWTGTKWETA